SPTSPASPTCATPSRSRAPPETRGIDRDSAAILGRKSVSAFRQPSEGIGPAGCASLPRPALPGDLRIARYRYEPRLLSAARSGRLAAGAVVGGGCHSVFDQLGEILGCHDDELGAVRVVDELGAGQRGETIAHQRGVLAERTQSQRLAHRYAPPLGAMSKT